MDAVAALQTLFGPARCEGCGAYAGALCNECRARVARADPAPPIPGVDRALVPWAYAGAARRLILGLKLRGNRAAATPLVDAMRADVLARGLAGDVVTWVPGRPGDRRRRGFDHAELLGRTLAGRTGLRASPLLVRLKNPPDQASLGAAQRRVNLHGAFGGRSCKGLVVVVDDLVTTGATARACAAALRSAGATGVELIAPCRA
jgi:predicted amidophosphoribosyltransferase